MSSASTKLYNGIELFDGADVNMAPTTYRPEMANGTSKLQEFLPPLLTPGTLSYNTNIFYDCMRCVATLNPLLLPMVYSVYFPRSNFVATGFGKTTAEAKDAASFSLLRFINECRRGRDLVLVQEQLTEIKTALLSLEKQVADLKTAIERIERK